MSRDSAIPNFAGWLVYCRICKRDREVRTAEEKNTAGYEYCELACDTCQYILLTFNRAAAKKAAMNAKCGNAE